MKNLISSQHGFWTPWGAVNKQHHHIGYGWYENSLVKGHCPICSEITGEETFIITRIKRGGRKKRGRILKKCMRCFYNFIKEEIDKKELRAMLKYGTLFYGEDQVLLADMILNMWDGN